MTREVKVKVTGEYASDVLQVIENIRKIHAPNAITSELKDSDHGGHHAFITIYMEA